MFSFQLLLLFVAFSFSNNPIFCNDNCIGKINTHFSLFFARPEGRPCPTQISVSDTASYALPTGVRVRCASDSGKRGSNTMSELHSAQVSSRPRLGKPFSPERENLSLNTDTGRPSEKLEPKTLNEILQLSLRRERLAWAKLAEVRLCSRTQCTKVIPKFSLIIPIQSISTIKPFDHALYPFKLPKVEV